MRDEGPQFIPFIHLLRGIAPLFVVWAHLGGAWYAGTHKAVLPAFTSFRQSVSAPLHLTGDGAHLAVMIFFIISGFIISHVAQTGSRAQFIMKRCLRILPTLLLAVLLVWLLSVASDYLSITQNYGNGAKSPADYIATALTYILAIDYHRAALGPVWSLYVEFVFYGIFAAWLLTAQRRPFAATIGMMISAALILTPAWFHHYAAEQSIFTGYLPMFIIGRLMYLHYRSFLSIGALAALTAINLALIFLVFEATRPGYLMGDPPFEPIVTYFAAVAIFFAAMKANMRSLPVPLAFLGNISYALYLLHEPIGNFTMNALYDYGAPLSAVIVAGIAASFIAAVIVTRWFERPIQSHAHLMARQLRQMRLWLPRLLLPRR